MPHPVNQGGASSCSGGCTIETMANVALSAYHSLLAKGWRFPFVDSGEDTVCVKAYPPGTSIRSQDFWGELGFQPHAGIFGEITVGWGYAGRGVGSALVGAAMSHTKNEIWYFTNFRDDNGVVFGNYLGTAMPGQFGSLTRRRRYDSFSVKRLVVPRRYWVLVNPERDVRVTGDSEGDSEASAIARKAIQGVERNLYDFPVVDVLADRLSPVLEKAQRFLITPPVADWDGRTLSLDMNGNHLSHAPTPAIVEPETFADLHAGASCHVQTFLNRRGEDLSLARLFY